MSDSILYPIAMIAGFILVLVAMLVLIRFVLPLAIDYELSQEAIEVRLFGTMATWRIAYGDVDSLEKVRFPGGGGWVIDPMVLRLGNRLSGDGVLVRKKKGLIRELVITPDHADEFIARVSARLERDEGQ